MTTTAHSQKNHLEKLLILTTGEFLDLYLTEQIESQLKKNYPLSYELLFIPLKINFSQVKFYSLFFTNHLFDNFLRYIAFHSRTAKQGRLNPIFECPLGLLESTLLFLKESKLLKWESLKQRISEFNRAISKNTRLSDISNFSLSLLTEINCMKLFLREKAASAAGIAEFLDPKNQENCDARYVENQEVVLLEFKSKNKSEGEIEHNNFSTALNDFVQNHKFNISALLEFFHPGIKNSLLGLMASNPMHYEEKIENLTEVIDDLKSKFSIDDNCSSVQKNHEECILLKMLDLYSEELTNNKLGYLIPSEEEEIKSYNEPMLIVSQKKFWCSIITKAINQLKTTKTIQEMDGLKVTKCIIYIMWERPNSLYANFFADRPQIIHKESLSQLCSLIEKKLNCCITNNAPSMKLITELNLLEI